MKYTMERGSRQKKLGDVCHTVQYVKKSFLILILQRRRKYAVVLSIHAALIYRSAEYFMGQARTKPPENVSLLVVNIWYSNIKSSTTIKEKERRAVKVMIMDMLPAEADPIKTPCIRCHFRLYCTMYDQASSSSLRPFAYSCTTTVQSTS